MFRNYISIASPPQTLFDKALDACQLCGWCQMCKTSTRIKDRYKTKNSAQNRNVYEWRVLADAGQQQQ